MLRLRLFYFLTWRKQKHCSGALWDGMAYELHATLKDISHAISRICDICYLNHVTYGQSRHKNYLVTFRQQTTWLGLGKKKPIIFVKISFVMLRMSCKVQNIQYQLSVFT